MVTNGLKSMGKKMAGDRKIRMISNLLQSRTRTNFICLLR